MRDQTKCIRDILNHAYIAIIVCLAVPIAIALISMSLIAMQYGMAMKSVQSSAAAQRILRDDLPDALWNIVSGRVTFEQGNQSVLFEQLEMLLDEMQASGIHRDSQSLQAVVRATETVRSYIDTIGDQIAHGQAVSIYEGTWEESLSVMGLAWDMLEQYSTEVVTEMEHIQVSIAKLIVFIFLFLIALMFVVLRTVLNSYRDMDHLVRKPIAELEEMASQIARGAFDIQTREVGASEIRKLTAHLNEMAAQLNTSFYKLVEKQKMLEFSELRTLQAQITPHFLYNTLETIIWLAEEGSTQEVVSLTISFTDFFRISLSGGQDYIPVEKERQHVASYLQIQSVRYGGMMEYRIKIASEIYAQKMPKLMLQPLVENAIYHGIKKKRGRGTILISGERQGNQMRFCVTDNGLGMTQEALRALYETIQTPSDKGGFGLHNISERLRLYCGGTLDIQSSYMEGTSVSFCLPLTEKEEKT